jgi:hypothetical protein
MERPPFQLKIVSLLGLVACIALNLWLFRLGPLPGIVGLNVTKHLVIAYLCQILGVDRRRRQGQDAMAAPPTRAGTLPVLSAAPFPSTEFRVGAERIAG